MDIIFVVRKLMETWGLPVYNVFQPEEGLCFCFSQVLVWCASYSGPFMRGMQAVVKVGSTVTNNLKLKVA